MGKSIVCMCVSMYLILCFPQDVVYYTQLVLGIWKT